MSHPLEDYALIGDGETAALLGRPGSIDWLCWPRFDSGACFAALLGTTAHGSWSLTAEDRATSRVGRDGVVLRAPVPLHLEEDCLSARATVTAGQRLVFVLSHGPSSEPPPQSIDAERALTATQTYWRDWIGGFDDAKTRWPEAIRRSLITLRAMIYEPSGGLVAAPTTSLPEAPGGDMNWDYRYCWLRDATFTVGALLNAGFHTHLAVVNTALSLSGPTLSRGGP